MATHESSDQLTEHRAIRRRDSEREGARTGGREEHPLLNLQRNWGNRYVARLLAQRDDDAVGGAPEVGLEGGPLSSDLSSRIEAQRGGGSSLDAGTQASMEASFGSRFDDVRVHSGSESDALNRSISAKAFTTGSDIFLSENASASDSHLMAHELTHVVQQRSSASSGGSMTVGPAGDSHEHAADAAASAVASGASVSGAQRELDESLAPNAIARQEEIPEEEIPEEEGELA